MYKWWVLLHLAGVFVFLTAHGVSVGVLFRLRREREPAKVAALLELSGTSVKAFYVGFAVLVIGGFAAVGAGHLWGKPWIWLTVALLVITSIAMTAMATPYYRRVGFVARAMVGGSEAVTPEQFDEVLKDNRSGSVAGIGIVALGLILYLMVLKPTFGLGSEAAPPPPPPGCTPPTCLQVIASDIKFDTDHLSAPANTPFSIVFDNKDPDQHNIAIYDGSTPLFQGQIFGGPKTMTYHVPALPPGTYTFRCDVHPTQMHGTFTIGPAGTTSSGPATPAARSTGAATSVATTGSATSGPASSGATTGAATSGPASATSTGS